MLEVRNLTKIYKPKKGVPVKALDNVSIKFPERGMVFLLGKSGSGKSTLLNLMGGLDSYNDGEIIIKGVSSKTFRQKHFDSYRNTYLGFIFQEYNILDEFTVGANIGLALELQGKKATDDEINRILAEVDLSGFGNRRPNELSGGQKQRVAIARALVKNPKIIMADEPTGALDSLTGRQIFDTLKRLSSDKLVIVVSHDREFAEGYADRIIELADGVVISDQEAQHDDSSVVEGISFEGEKIAIPFGYHLTEDDRTRINDYIDRLKSGGQLEFSTGIKKKFATTDEGKISFTDSESFKLIKSKLSLRNSFKIGAAGLKFKKFRLVMTIILSCVAFVLFGLSDTLAAYNHVNTCTESLIDSNVSYTSLKKSEKDEDRWINWGNGFTVDEAEQIEEELGVSLTGVKYAYDSGASLDFTGNLNSEKQYNINHYDYYVTRFDAACEINKELIDEMGYSFVAGRIPDGSKREIAISSFVLETFKYGGYKIAFDESKPLENNEIVSINSAEDIIGKTLSLNGTDFEIVGVVDTKFDNSRFTSLFEGDDEEKATSDSIIDYVLYNEFSISLKSNLTGILMVGEGGFEQLFDDNFLPFNDFFLYFINNDYRLTSTGLMKLDDFDSDSITWIDGKKDKLGKNEIIVRDYSLPGEWVYNESTGIESFVPDKATIREIELVLNIENYTQPDTEWTTEEGYRVVGVCSDNKNGSYQDESFIVSDELYNTCAEISSKKFDYSLLVGALPTEQNELNEFVALCYDDSDGVRYELQNPVCYELDNLNTTLKAMGEIFLYIGLAFAAFAALLLSNFIATSISYKKQEIGILRAIGSRSVDVFKIFFSESFIIAMINFVLSTIGVFAAVVVANGLIRDNTGLLITVLSFSVRQVILLFAVSFFVAAVASFLPVKKLASKKPIDAIRGR